MIKFLSDIPTENTEFILVANYADLNDILCKVCNLAVMDYKSFYLGNKIGVWKIKQLKQ